MDKKNRSSCIVGVLDILDALCFLFFKNTKFKKNMK